MLFFMFVAVIRRYERLYLLSPHNGRFCRCRAFPIFSFEQKQSHRLIYYAEDSKYATFHKNPLQNH